MPEIGDDGDADHIERIADKGETLKSAWSQTNEDMQAMAEQRRENGWEAVAIPAVHTAPTSRDAGDDDRFGIVYVIPNNYADDFSEALERGTFPRFEAYRNEIDGFVFLVVELLDPETETAILLAGQYELHNAQGMVTAARDEGALYTHVKVLDGTILGSIRHEAFEPLVPERYRV